MCASNSSVLYRGAHLVPDRLRPRRGFGVSSARDREAGRRAEASALSINRARFAAGCARAFGAALLLLLLLCVAATASPSAVTYSSPCRSSATVLWLERLDRISKKLEQLRLQHVALDAPGVLLLSVKYTTATTPVWSLCV
jgi:hypothetical protein